MFQSAFCNLLFLVTGMLFGNSSAPDLREGHEAVKRIRQKMMWRYRLTGSRCKAVLRRCRGEVVRCTATRRHTRDTSDCCAGEDREKSPGFRVNSGKWFALFQCTVNWPRARLTSALIAGGAQPSRSRCAVNLKSDCSNHSICKLHLVGMYPIMNGRLTRSARYRLTIPPAEKTYL